MELTIRTIGDEFRCYLGGRELGLIWPGASLIDEASVFHPADSDLLMVKIVFKNWLGGLHEAYHDKVLKTMDETMWALVDAEMNATFWLRPNLAHLAEGDRELHPKKRNDGNDNNV